MIQQVMVNVVAAAAGGRAASSCRSKRAARASAWSRISETVLPTGCLYPGLRRIVGRMPRLQVYLPDDLYNELKRRELPASELLQVAVRAELERRDVLDATDDYLTELAAEVGEPTARQQARADAIVRRIRDRQLHQAG